MPCKKSACYKSWQATVYLRGTFVRKNRIAQNMKELLIKLYQDKPPRIGILYGNEFVAGKEYASILSKYKNERFRARLEVVKENIHLTLISEFSHEKVIYKDLYYKGDQLKKLQVFVKRDEEIQFVHIYPVENKLLIAKPHLSKKMELVMIHQYEVLVNGEYFPMM